MTTLSESELAEENHALRQRIRELEATIASNTREFGRLYGAQDKARAEAIALLDECLTDVAGMPKDLVARIQAFYFRVPAQPAAPVGIPIADCIAAIEGSPAYRAHQPAAPEPSLDRFFGAIPDMPLEPAAPEPSAEDEPPECDNCGTPIDGNQAATSDVCWDCWRSARDQNEGLFEQLKLVGNRSSEHWMARAEAAESKLAAVRREYNNAPENTRLDRIGRVLALLTPAPSPDFGIGFAATAQPYAEDQLRSDDLGDE